VGGGGEVCGGGGGGRNAKITKTNKILVRKNIRRLCETRDRIVLIHIIYVVSGVV